MNIEIQHIDISMPYVLRVNDLGDCRCGECRQWIKDGDHCFEGPTWLCLKCGPKVSTQKGSIQKGVENKPWWKFW